MKIAFIIGYFPECASFLVNQITGLIDLGHKVEIFALEENHGKMIIPDIDRYQLMKRIHFFAIPKSKIQRIFSTFALFFKQPLRMKWRLLCSLNILKFKGQALRLNTFYYIYPFLNKEFNIIHAHFGPNGLIGVFLKKMRVPGKLITTFYGYDLSLYVNKNGPQIYQDLFKYSSHLLPICDYFKKKIIKLGGDEKKITTHPVGIDLSKFSYFNRKYKSGNKVILLTIARLVEKKGIEFSLRAFAKINKQFLNTFYYIAGNGPLENKLKRLAENLGIAKSVKFLGLINQSEEIEILKKANIFILTSTIGNDGDEEGTPTVLLEAQAVGLPVISTFHSGIPEVVINGQSGFLVPEKDVGAIVEKITFLLENPHIWKEMGMAGRLNMEKNFDLNVIIKKLERIYRKKY